MNCSFQKLCPSCFRSDQEGHDAHVWTAECWPSDYTLGHRWLAAYLPEEAFAGLPSMDALKSALVAELVLARCFIHSFAFISSLECSSRRGRNTRRH